MKTYTKDEVIKLLNQQKEICLKSAKIIEHQYINPYSESDGQITRKIDENSILNANYPTL